MTSEALIVATAARLSITASEVRELLRLYHFVLSQINVPLTIVTVLLPGDVRWLVHQWKQAIG